MTRRLPNLSRDRLPFASRSNTKCQGAVLGMPSAMIVRCMILAGCTLAGGAALGAERITITLLDGTTRHGALEQIADGELRAQLDNQASRIVLEQVARIDFVRLPATHPAPRDFELHLVGDGMIRADLIEPARDAVSAQTSLGEKLKFPFQSLDAIRNLRIERKPAAMQLFESAQRQRQAGKDVLIAEGGDGPQAIPGTLAELGPQAGEFLYNNRPRRISIEKVYGVVFAEGLASSLPAGALLHLTNGERIPGVIQSCNAEQVQLRTPFAPSVSIPIDRVRSIEMRSDRLVYLSDLEPITYESSGLLHDTWPFHRDRSAGNTPLTLDGVVYDKGIGLHARATLVFNLGGAYETLAATVGIDDAVRPAGSVEFVVIADGNELLRQGPLTGKDQAVNIVVPVAGVQRLTLTADSTDGVDIGDWADWASLRLIKSRQSS